MLLYKKIEEKNKTKIKTLIYIGHNILYLTIVINLILNEIQKPQKQNNKRSYTGTN
jgi:hypothetical protein